MARVRAVSRELVPNNINCKIKGFDISITNRSCDWREAKRILRKLAVRYSQTHHSEEEDSDGDDHPLTNSQVQSKRD